jgi:rhodanese-related sulfurtransferase
MCVPTHLDMWPLSRHYKCVLTQLPMEDPLTETITRTELETLLARGEVVVVDALPASYYEQAHIPGAVNLVESEVDGKAGSLLPDKNAPIVTYCSNETCGNSQAVATRLERLGYTSVRKYREGIQDWVTAGNPTASTQAA